MIIHRSYNWIRKPSLTKARTGLSSAQFSRRCWGICCLRGSNSIKLGSVFHVLSQKWFAVTPPRVILGISVLSHWGTISLRIAGMRLCDLLCYCVVYAGMATFEWEKWCICRCGLCGALSYPVDDISSDRKFSWITSVLTRLLPNS